MKTYRLRIAPRFLPTRRIDDYYSLVQTRVYEDEDRSAVRRHFEFFTRLIVREGRRAVVRPRTHP